MEIDLNNEMFTIGGSNSPDLYFDGTNLTMKGNIVAGLIESVNWSTTQGIQIDLNNEKLLIGGSDTPDLSWDGATLSVSGSSINGTMKANSVRIESGDGNTYFDGNTMYVYDDSGNLRVKLGEI
jgi:hypothetical protein